ncbi:MAG: COX15/CtaA family protein [Saprospiraceae bacterium]|jgi:cytochrome c oxidase assembly protein subunit 15|nr:COX15/CtaA family protein [Saprospiraceae bacterium]
MTKQLSTNKSYPNALKVWLYIGLFMLLVQVVVGGITRLTGSGLSITKWEIVTGTLPPFNDTDWNMEFDLYKETPQYREINEGMSLSDFKFIYFWEYIHRFWARTMGFVFLLPFIFFWLRGYIDDTLIRGLSSVVLLAVLAASFGWIMVASGLIERPWVNAYKLAIHLSIAFCVYAALFWTFLKAFHIRIGSIDIKYLKMIRIFIILLAVQIFAGGVMSGMKAGVIYPTWPDMNAELIPQVIFNINEYTVDNFNYYDRNILLPALVHVVHRSVAYILFFLGLYISIRLIRESKNTVIERASWLLIIMLITQVLLGIWTVISCDGNIPILQGVLHQAGALFLLTAALYLLFLLGNSSVVDES